MPEASTFGPLKPAHLHILISTMTGPIHGYGIRRVVEERTEGRILLPAGTLYHMLQRLTADELICETDPPDEERDASSRWRFYRITPLGRDVVREEIQRMERDLTIARAISETAG